MFLINGQAGERLSLFDRSIHYGDGVFETIAVSHGAPLGWDRHLRRLEKGCRVLGIPAPSPSLLKQEADRLIKDQSLAVLKIIISRGEGGRGYQSPRNIKPTRILGLYNWPDYPAENSREGIKAGICATRLGHNPVLAGIKHLNRLEQVLARSEPDTGGFQENIMLDVSDSVIEGTMSNVFIISHNTLMTPDLNACGIEGIVRGLILDQAADWGLKVQVKPLSLEEVKNADAIFFCNSIIGIWPVREFLDRSYAVGDTVKMIGDRLTGNRQITAP